MKPQFPADIEKTIVQVFYMKGNPAFVCGVNGGVSPDMIEEIEKDFADNEDEGFENGDGEYLYEVKWEPPQVDGMGEIEVPGYWDLKEIGFRLFAWNEED